MGRDTGEDKIGDRGRESSFKQRAFFILRRRRNRRVPPSWNSSVYPSVRRAIIARIHDEYLYRKPFDLMNIREKFV